MKRASIPLSICITLLLLPSCLEPVPESYEANNIRSYLSTVAEEITDNALSDVVSLADWGNQREQRYLEFIEMMGLQDMPMEGERPDLNIKITGTIQQEGYRIEKLYYESLPGLYVPANLYIPDDIQEPGPAGFCLSDH
jgi:hypothetical protein